MMKIMIPPIKCQGIKSKLVPFIKRAVDWSFEGRWIEPFMGSGVVGFNIIPRDAVFADSNPHLINFYNAIAGGEIDGLKVRIFLENRVKYYQDVVKITIMRFEIGSIRHMHL